MLFGLFRSSRKDSMADKKENTGQRYIAGVVQEDGVFKIRLNGVRKNGEGDGEHLEAERFEVNGFMEADERGRLLLIAKGGELEGSDKGDNAKKDE